MDKEREKLPEAEKEPVRSEDITNANAAGDGALERSEENDLTRDRDPLPKPETPY